MIDRHNNRCIKSLAILVCFSFLLTSFVWPTNGYAATRLEVGIQLPPVGELIPLSKAYTPTIVRGLSLHPDNPLQFDFIIDTGDDDLDGEAFQKEATKLIKYFLTSLTVSEDDLWVNLSPYEHDRIIPQALGKTQLGRDLLAQDYILKQLTASLMYPEGETGRKFWDRVYKRAYQLYGTTSIPVDTFNKVWIVPDKAVVYEHGRSVFVVERHLKVMLEGDYLAIKKSHKENDTDEPHEGHLSNDISSKIIREVLIPEIEREVNEGKNFATLRQIYNSMILAVWYKKNLRGSLLGDLYIDQNKMKGISLQDQTIHQKIYKQYLEAFKKGVYDYIREDYEGQTQKVITRKYFSGGATGIREVDLEIRRGTFPGQSGDVGSQMMGPKGEDRRVTWRADIARPILGENRVIQISSDRGDIEVEIGSFPDGEIRLRALNPELIRGGNVVLNHYVHSCDDVVQVLLLMGLLRQYGVASIRLVLAGWKPMSEEESDQEGNGYLLSILSLLADELAYVNQKSEITPIYDFRKIETIEKKNFPRNSTRLLYIDHQFKKSAMEAAKMLQNEAVTDHLIMQSRNGQRLVELPDDLKGQDVVLYHSTESSQQIEELLLILAALRKEGVASISLVNTYLGYARQDKISRPGESRSAETILRLINNLVDHHFVMNVHYGKESGQISLDKDDFSLGVHNLNGFISIAESMANDIIKRIANVRNLESLTRDEAKALGQKIEAEFTQHPIVIVGPDKGSKIYSQETRRELERLIYEAYGVQVPVHVGYMSKERDPQTGNIKRDSMQLLDIETDAPITHLGEVPLNKGWAFVLDDMTDTGGTLLSATYILSEKLGFQWRRILNGVVHGTLSKRLVPFKTGLTSQEIDEATAATRPRDVFIDPEKGRMPPISLYAMETILLPRETSSFHHVSTGPIMSYVMRRIIRAHSDAPLLDREEFYHNTRYGKPKKVAIIGGTFDPFHVGHQKMADDIKEELGVDEVVFVPTHVSPHKVSHPPIASGQERYDMVKAAIQDRPDFRVSDFEINREGPSYTINLVEHLEGQYPEGSKVFVVIGEDNVAGLNTWHRIDDLRQKAKFVAYTRVGYPEIETDNNVIQITRPALEISATKIRERAATGHSLRGFVAEAVQRILEKDNPYSPEKIFSSDPKSGEIKSLTEKPIPNDKPFVAVFDVHGVILEPTWKEEYAFAYHHLTQRSTEEGLQWVDEYIVKEMIDTTRDVPHQEIIRKLKVSVRLATRKDLKDSDIEDALKEAREYYGNHFIHKAKGGVSQALRGFVELGIPILFLSGSNTAVVTKQLIQAGLGEFVRDANVIGQDQQKQLFRDDELRQDLRGRMIEHVARKFSSRRVIYFDDWVGGATAVKSVGGINVGIPQGSAQEFKRNYNRLVYGAGADFILRGPDDWRRMASLVKILDERRTRATQTHIKKKIRLAMAQVNPKVGDLVGNFRLIVDNLQRAKTKDVDVLVFPELMMTGYPPEDLLKKRHFVLQNKEMLRLLLRHTEGITAVVGFVDIDRRGHIYNATAIISNGKLKGIYRKNALPNYGVFDEKRYFTRGKGAELLDFEGNVLNEKVFELDGVKIAVNTCEDVWIQPETGELVEGIPEPMDTELPPVYLEQAGLGANLIINNSASPFRKGVVDTREQLLKRRVQETGATIAYTNLIGGQDELVFDGSSFVVNSQGEIVARGEHFGEDFVIADLEIDTYEGDRGEAPHVIPLSKTTAHESKAKIEAPKRSLKLSELEAMERALVLALRDYARKNGFEKFVYGNSGGIDSAYTGYLLAQAFGGENVTAISMPTQFNSRETRSDAESAAGLLGVQHQEISIQELYESYVKVLSGHGWIKEKTTLENIQARIRGALLMAFSNDNPGTLVITTGNKSETSVGYATLYGDTAGGFAPLKDVFKTYIFKLARYANEKALREIIPASIIDRAPSAELSEGQRDEDSLPPYVSTLDPILEGLIEGNRSIADLSKTFDPATVRKVRQMIDRAEHKRRQGPPGPKISRLALGRERRMPITLGYDEEGTRVFIEELGSQTPAQADHGFVPSDLGSGKVLEKANRMQPEGYPDRDVADPPAYTSPAVTKNARSRKSPEGWADPDLDETRSSAAERHRFEEGSRAFIQTYSPKTQFVNGRPRNREETGLNGRGDLGWYGPNLAEDAIILRLNQDGEVEVLAGQRDDDSEGWALAGQFAKREEVGFDFVGVTASKAAYREFNVKIDLKRDGVLVYEGLAGDWRDTNDAWVLTRGVAVLLTHEESLLIDVEAKKGMRTGSVRWINARDDTQRFYARHRTLIDRALDKIGAEQLRTSQQKKINAFEELTMTIQQLDEAFDAFRAGKQNYRETYDLVIPQAPHGGGYYIAAGLEETLADIRRRRFSPDHVEALRKLGRYSDEFLEYLSQFIFEGDVSALREGSVVTSEIPVMRINASPLDIKLLEGLIKNRMAFSTNIATKTSRIVQAANGAFVTAEERARLIHEEGYDPVQERLVIDYSQRRAQEKGATAASRAAIIGGASGTSNVKAAKQHYLEPNGTMAHAFVMMFPLEDEIEAFRVYAETYPDTSIFLIDTYDAIEGAKKAIQVAKEMEKEGHNLLGLRIDSGDLVILSKEIRNMLNGAGLSYVKIIASNDLNEEVITDLLSQGARIDGFGVGTHLGTGGKQAALEMKIVKSDEKRYWRVHQNRGQIQKFVKTQKGRTPMAAYQEDLEELLIRFWRDGMRVSDSEKPWQAHLRAQADTKRLKPEQKKLKTAVPIPIEERDNPLSINPETDAYLAVDIQGAFLRRGGLSVKDANDILAKNRSVMNLFPKQNRFASLDQHPKGHVSLASSYNGLAPLATVLTSDVIKDWTEESNPIAEHALFNLADLHVYLEGGFKKEQYTEFVDDVNGLLQELKERGYVNQYGVKLDHFNNTQLEGFILSDKFKTQREQIFTTLKKHRGVGFQVLWTDHALEGSREEKLHRSILEKEFQYVVIKGMDGKDDSYSPFASNAGVPTELDAQIRPKGKGPRRLFLTGLAYDYCVGSGACSAADLGYDEVYVVIDSTKPVGFPADSISNMEAAFKSRGIKVITTQQLIDANQNLGVKIASSHETPIAHPTIFEEDEGTALEEDFYHLTMGQAMFRRGFHKRKATFDYFYRKPPFSEPYVIVSGVKFFLKDLMNFKFSDDDIQYLRRTERFTDEYLDFLAHFRFSGSIDGLKEGDVAFPQEPIATVTGSMFEIIIETLMLKDLNFPTLDASWANHLALRSEGKQIVEHGLSTAQGRSHKNASWAAFIGGANRTTNIDAHLAHGIPLATKNDEGVLLGGNILTGGEKAAHGGVFKLSSIDGEDRAKVSGGDPSKASLPGRKRSYEVMDGKGKVVGVVIGYEDGDNLGIQDTWTSRPRQIPWVRNGDVVYSVTDPFEVRAYARDQVRRYGDLEKAAVSPKLAAAQRALIDRAHKSKLDLLMEEAMDSSFLDRPMDDAQKDAIKERLRKENPQEPNPVKVTSIMSWDTNEYENAHRPVVVGELPEELRPAFSEQRGIRILDMAIRMPGQGWAIPKILEPYREMIRMAVEDQRAINPNFDDEYYVYVTIDQKEVAPGKAQRRVGWHGDAYITPETTQLFGPDGKSLEVPVDTTYVASDALTTLFLPGPFSLKGIDQTDDQQVLKRFEELAKGKEPERYSPYLLARMTPYDVHTPDVNNTDKTIKRTFIKIQFSRDKLNRMGNAINRVKDRDGNPVLRYDDWIWAPRNPNVRNSRNSLLDYERPDKEEFQIIDPKAVDFDHEKADVDWLEGEFFWAKKVGTVRAERATEGEVLESRGKNGVITYNMGQKGSWKITTGQGDQYFITDKIFRRRYNHQPNKEGRYVPTGWPQKMIKVKRPIRFIAPWGAWQYVPAGSVLTKLGDDNIYAIMPENFDASFMITNQIGLPLLVGSQIPTGMDLSEKVEQVTFVLDVDRTLTRHGKSFITEDNLRQIVRAFQLKEKNPRLSIRFIIVSDSGYKRYVLSEFAPKIEEWDLKMLGEEPADVARVMTDIFAELRALGYEHPEEVRAQPFTVRAIEDRVIRPLRKRLQQLGLEKHLKDIELRTVTGGEIVRFNAEKNDFEVIQNTNKSFDVAEQLELAKILTVKYLEEFGKKTGRDMQPFIQRIQATKNFVGQEGVDVIFREAMGESRAIIWALNTQICILFRGNQEKVDGPLVAEEIRKAVQASAVLASNVDKYIIEGDERLGIKITLLDKATEVSPMIRDDEYVIGLGDGENDTFLFRPANQKTISIFLGEHRQIKQYPHVVTARDSKGQDNVREKGVAAFLRHLLGVMARGGVWGDVEFLDNHYSPNQVGGIDLGLVRRNLEIRSDRQGRVASRLGYVPRAIMSMEINGIYLKIIRISPISAPNLLGVRQKQEQESSNKLQAVS